jgi:hypothetical protein
MSRILPLACACGAVRGELELRPGAGQRMVCYCDDCQAYARWLREGITDDRGGTDLWQTRPSLVRITQGLEQLACVRLTDRGMFRWYARCCRTPVGNTLASPGAPFVGIPVVFVDPGARDEALGPPFARVQGRFAIGGVPPGVHPSAGVGTLLRSAVFLARSVLAGGHRPSPFRDEHTGAPRVEPEILGPRRG